MMTTTISLPYTKSRSVRCNGKYLRGKFRHLQDPLADLAGGNLPPNAKIFVNGEETTRARLQEQFRKILDYGYDFLETDYHHD